MKRGLSFKAVIAAVAAVGALVTAWALLSSPSAVPPRARHYLDVSACLLTGPGGIASATAGAQAWHALQSASLASHVMVSYLPDTGRTDVPTMINTLVERRCEVIVVTGAPQLRWHVRRPPIRGDGSSSSARAPPRGRPRCPPILPSFRLPRLRDASIKKSVLSQPPPEHPPYLWSGSWHAGRPGFTGTSGVASW